MKVSQYRRAPADPKSTLYLSIGLTDDERWHLGDPDYVQLRLSGPGRLLDLEPAAPNQKGRTRLFPVKSRTLPWRATWAVHSLQPTIRMFCLDFPYRGIDPAAGPHMKWIADLGFVGLRFALPTVGKALAAASKHGQADPAPAPAPAPDRLRELRAEINAAAQADPTLRLSISPDTGLLIVTRTIIEEI